MFEIKSQEWLRNEPGNIEYKRFRSPAGAIEHINQAPMWDRQIISVRSLATNTLYTPLQFVSLYSEGRVNI